MAARFALRHVTSPLYLRRTRRPLLRPRAASTSAPPAEALPAFVQAAGGDAGGVAVKAAGAALGYSLVAARSVAVGDTLVSLPRDLLLTDGGAAPLPPAAEAGLAALQAAVPRELWGGRLAVRLLAHRAAGDASPFASYVAALPTGFPLVPIFFSRDAVDAARAYPPFHAQIVKRAAWVSSFARDHLALDARAAAAARANGADPLQGWTVDAAGLGWAFAAVTSRAFAVAGGGDAAPRALLPLIDMANHAGAAASAEVVPGPAGGVVLRARHALVEGAPITLNYGALPSDEFLLDYGFVDTAKDSVTLRLDGLLPAAAALAGTAPAAPAAAWRAAARAALGPPPAAGVRVLAAPPHVDGRLLAEARIEVASAASDLKGVNLTDPGAALPPAVEAKALRTLAAAALVTLSSMGGPAEADRAALSGADLAADVAAVTAVVLSKKETLQGAARGLGEAAKRAETRKVKKAKPAPPKGRGFG